MFGNISNTLTGIASAATNDVLAANVIMIIFFVLLTLAATVVAVFLIGKYHALTNDETTTVGRVKPIHVFFIILAVGVALRLLLTFVVKGYGPTYSTAYGIANGVVGEDSGFSGFTSEYRSVAPLTAYLYTLFAGWGIAAGATMDSIAMQFFVRLPFMLADVALVCVIYYLARKYSNRYVALALCGMYFINPLSFIVSSMWGSEMILLALALVVLSAFVLSKNMFGICLTAAAACLVSSYAVFIVPVVGVYVVYTAVKSVVNIVKAKPSFDSVMRDQAYYNVFYAPLCLLLGFSVMYLVSLPAYFADGVVSFGSVMNQLFVQPFTVDSSALSRFTENGLGIYTVITNNFESVGPQFKTLVFAVLFVVISAVFTVVFWLMKRNRSNLILISSFMAFTVAVYMMGSDEWSLLPALVLMIPAFAATKDKRIFKVFAPVSLFVVINAMLSLFGGGMLSGTLVTGVTVTNLKQLGGAYNAFSILLSVLTVLLHIYYAVVVLDIAVARNRKEFITDRTAGFGECMRGWVRG